jgi:two-component system OmpR family sensor kinase/two-component system sensor histidine kinase BaeS
MSQQPHDHSDPPQERRSSRRFFPVALFFFFIILLFFGGTAAFLYLIFSEFTGVRNWWLLFCGAPVIVVVIAIIIIINLYRRFGRPLERIFNAIDTVAEGDLSVRVPENDSDMYSELSKRFNHMIGELERAEQQRRNLTADVAHELRTPLHIIQGNLEGIIDGVYQPTPEHINNTLEETRLLSRLVNDLQTLSLAETGQLPLHLTRFLLADLIADLISSFSTHAASQGIHLTSAIADPGLEITADYDRLNQVLSNLVSNALRHTPSGGRVAIEIESIAGEKRSVRIQVKDTGTGIASEDIPFIFDRFWRGDKSRSDRVHSGLGLAITKQLIQAHDGEISVQSDGLPGKGTTFIIELPE